MNLRLRSGLRFGLGFLYNDFVWMKNKFCSGFLLMLFHFLAPKPFIANCVEICQLHWRHERTSLRLHLIKRKNNYVIEGSYINGTVVDWSSFSARPHSVMHRVGHHWGQTASDVLMCIGVSTGDTSPLDVWMAEGKCESLCPPLLLLVRNPANANTL